VNCSTAEGTYAMRCLLLAVVVVVVVVMMMVVVRRRGVVVVVMVMVMMMAVVVTMVVMTSVVPPHVSTGPAAVVITPPGVLVLPPLAPPAVVHPTVTVMALLAILSLRSRVCRAGGVLGSNMRGSGSARSRNGLSDHEPRARESHASDESQDNFLKHVVPLGLWVYCG
jgi:hypothetical protein